MPPVHLLAAFDKFRGTLAAAEACHAALSAAHDSGWTATAHPLADGGEGTLEALGGPNRTSWVMGPLGEPVRAAWRLEGGVAVIEMAEASGLLVAGGPGRNHPLTATTRGTGELIRAALQEGAHTVVVGVGGSATTDGGLGAVEVLGLLPAEVRLEVAADVTSRFLDAARIYGPQKGATPEEVTALEQRLAAARSLYLERYGVDVADVPGSGAAGGLAGGLMAVGGTIRSGFDLVAELTNLADRVAEADLVVTGEGRLDATSWAGKVVGGVARLAREASVPVTVVAGDVDGLPPAETEVVSLSGRYGIDRAMQDTRGCIEEVTRELLRRHRRSDGPPPTGGR